MKSSRFLLFAALVSVLCYGAPATAQHTEPAEETTAHTTEDQPDEHAEEAAPEEHGEEHGGRPHHKNDIGLFLGVTDEHGHSSEFTWGLDYKRRVADRWAVGAFFDYAGGDLRNAIFAASVTWSPVGGLTLTAAPGIEFHRGRGSSEDCGCSLASKSEDTGGHGEVDEDATYFVMRFGVGWGFTIGESYAIEPQVNIDLVNGEKVWVYGVNLIYAW